MRVLLGLLLVLPLAGCAGDAGSDAPSVEGTARLAPRGYAGAFHEVNLQAEAGAAVTWSFEATGPLTWDVHTHEGRDVVTLENGTSAGHEGGFTAARAGVYSLFFQNRDPREPVDVTYRVRGAVEAAS